MDKDPTLHIDTGDGELLLTPENTTLFTHVGEAAMYDHVFVQTGEADGTPSGAYIFPRVMREPDAFKAIKKHLTRHRFPMVLNQREVAECDRLAFEHSVDNQIEDYESFPDDWA